MPILQQIEERGVSDVGVSTALEVVHDALEESFATVKECCEVSFFVAMICANKYNQQLKQATTSLGHVLDQLPLAAIGIASDLHDGTLVVKGRARQNLFSTNS